MHLLSTPPLILLSVLSATLITGGAAMDRNQGSSSSFPHPSDPLPTSRSAWLIRKGSELAEEDRAQRKGKRRASHGTNEFRAPYPVTTQSSSALKGKGKARAKSPPRTPRRASITEFPPSGHYAEFPYEDFTLYNDLETSRHAREPPRTSRPVHVVSSYITSTGNDVLGWFRDVVTLINDPSNPRARDTDWWVGLLEKYVVDTRGLRVPASPGAPARYMYPKTLSDDTTLLVMSLRNQCRPPRTTGGQETYVEAHKEGYQAYVEMSGVNRRNQPPAAAQLIDMLIRTATPLNIIHYSEPAQTNYCIAHLFNVMLGIYYQENALKQFAPSLAQ